MEEKAPSGLSLVNHDEDPDTLDEFDSALYKLVEAGKTSPEQALRDADEPDKLQPMLEELAQQQDNYRDTTGSIQSA